MLFSVFCNFDVIILISQLTKLMNVPTNNNIIAHLLNTTTVAYISSHVPEIRFSKARSRFLVWRKTEQFPFFCGNWKRSYAGMRRVVSEQYFSSYYKVLSCILFKMASITLIVNDQFNFKIIVTIWWMYSIVHVIALKLKINVHILNDGNWNYSRRRTRTQRIYSYRVNSKYYTAYVDRLVFVETAVWQQ